MNFCSGSKYSLRLTRPGNVQVMLTVDSFMEGGRIRSSVALPREVAKPTVIDDDGEKITLKIGQQIYTNLVRLSLPTLHVHATCLTKNGATGSRKP